MRKFLEMEAELGSDNEKHDHKRKKIRGNEEEESDLDDDLEGFVDYADDKEIGGANESMLKKFQ